MDFCYKKNVKQNMAVSMKFVILGIHCLLQENSSLTNHKHCLISNLTTFLYNIEGHCKARRETGFCQMNSGWWCGVCPKYACKWSSLAPPRISNGLHICQLDLLRITDYIVFVSWIGNVCSIPSAMVK